MSWLDTTHPLCGRGHRRFHDPHEGAAPADVAVKTSGDLLARRIRIALEKRGRRNDEAWRAEAAHQRVDVAERLLNRMERVPGRETVHRADLLADDVDRECGTGI